MRIGYLQFSPALLDPAETMRRLEALLPRCAGADLVVLPELCNSGYAFADGDEARSCAEPADNSRFLDFLADWCRRLDCAIVSGFNEAAGDKLYNSAVLLTPEGVRGLYRKLHLFNREKLFFAPGDLGLPLFEWRGARLGMLICFDWIFPEVWRSLALAGAEIVAHPSNLVLPGLAQKATPVHALINRFYVITANRTGDERGTRYTGASLIADARGNLLAASPTDADDVAIVEIDPALARDKQVTERNHLFSDRRPEFYDL
jgi:predicted amidohydrolase